MKNNKRHRKMDRIQRAQQIQQLPGTMSRKDAEEEDAEQRRIAALLTASEVAVDDPVISSDIDWDSNSEDSYTSNSNRGYISESEFEKWNVFNFKSYYEQYRRELTNVGTRITCKCRFRRTPRFVKFRRSRNRPRLATIISEPNRQSHRPGFRFTRIPYTISEPNCPSHPRGFRFSRIPYISNSPVHVTNIGQNLIPLTLKKKDEVD